MVALQPKKKGGLGRKEKAGEKWRGENGRFWPTLLPSLSLVLVYAANATERHCCCPAPSGKRVEKSYLRRTSAKSGRRGHC